MEVLIEVQKQVRSPNLFFVIRELDKITESNIPRETWEEIKYDDAWDGIRFRRGASPVQEYACEDKPAFYEKKYVFCWEEVMELS